VILLTGLGDREIDVEAMKAGAADYLIKGQINATMLERSINHSLQRKEAERKLRASEERLRLSQKLESVGTLAGGIAHDFNNILTIIAVFANRLREQTLPIDQREKMIDSVDETVKRGAALVRQLLTFARQTEVQFESVQINEVVVGWIKMLQETFPKSVRFSSNLSDSLPPILADITQLHQILLNLCLNARDAMNGRGLIRISTRLTNGAQLREKDVQAPSERYVCLEVSDTGCGMDAATQKRIFDPFFTTKDKEQGTGLGLAIVYGIVRSHHGHIELDSAPGSGSTFRIYLPATLINGSHGK
jgi:signal transduction histidine kinase